MRYISFLFFMGILALSTHSGAFSFHGIKCNRVMCAKMPTVAADCVVASKERGSSVSEMHPHCWDAALKNQHKICSNKKALHILRKVGISSEEDCNRVFTKAGRKTRSEKKTRGRRWH